MATITSTIRLVDQMSPTLNKISKSIDRINKQTNAMGSVRTFNGFNSGMQRATKSTHNLYYALRRVVFLLGALRGLKGLFTAVDSMINATARLNNINDGLYTTSEYLDTIYQSAQRCRTSFSEMTTTVGKLGTVAGHAFGSVNEMIAFTELMNKLFIISGASGAEASNAMYQLTQAMAAGRLQGDEMRSILENAPLLAQKIADYLGVSVGEVKELGAEGKITADVIKNALFSAADEIETKFENMPKTFAHIWNEIKNHCLNAFRPVIERISQFINSPIFEKFKTKIFSIITSVANAVIRLFDVFETPRVQNAISKIGTAIGVLRDIVIDVGNIIAKVLGFTMDNWNSIGQAIYAVIMIVLLYKAISLAVSAAVCIANIAQGIAAWVAALMAGQAWAWVILIIIALIAIIYLGVAAWNYFTDSTISATGVLFGSIAFVVSGVVWLFQVIWDAFVLLCKILIQLGADILETCAALLINLLALVLNIFSAIGTAIRETAIGIGGTFKWLWMVVKTWGGNVATGMSQLCQQLPLYWEYFKAATVAKFWELVVGAGSAFNSLLKGASDIARKMVSPFEKFANAVVGLLNKIIRGWNSLTDKLTLTLPSFSIMGKQLWGEQKIKLIGGHISELDSVSWTDWADPSGINLSGATNSLSNASGLANALKGSIKPINWSTNELPSYSDYVNWGNIGNAIKDAFHLNEYESLSGIWEGSKYSDIWGSFKSGLSNNVNPIEAFKSWYDKGAKLEDGVNGLVDGIGALIGALFGGSGSSNGLGTDDLRNEMFDIKGGGNSIPGSMEDLLAGSSPSAGLPNLGTIADNTGKTAGSLANIEDTMNLAEEELELLRSLAEQEVINRFTTAEIRVDMTNNNNINSGMDLDGIVTHLSTKLYEELGVVASGVHY